MLASHKMLASLMKRPHSKYIRKAYNSTAKKKKKKKKTAKEFNLKMVTAAMKLKDAYSLEGKL